MKTQKTKLIIFAVIITAAIVSGIFIVKSNNNSKFQQQLKLGNEALLNMDYEAAVTAFANAIGLNPKDVQAYLGITEAYVAMDDFKNASEYLSKGRLEIPHPSILTLLDSLTAEDFTSLGKEFMTQGDPNSAKDAFEEALKREPENEDAKKGIEDAENHPDYDSNSDSNPETSDNEDSTNNNIPDTLPSHTGSLSQEELMQCNMNISNAYYNYINGQIDNERVKKLCDSWIPILEAQKNNNMEQVNLWGLSLSHLYYMNRDFAACTNLLNELYSLTGNETYLAGGEEPVSSAFDGSTMTGTRIRNEYGVVVQENLTIMQDGWGYTEDISHTYNADGKVEKSISHNEYIGGTTEHTEHTYEYDSEGRIIKSTSNTLTTHELDAGSSGNAIYSYTYNGDSVTQQAVYTYTSDSGITEETIETSGTMGEYGITWNY